MQTSDNKRVRLPQLRQSNDSGYVYVSQRGDAFKIGFTRVSVDRRARDNHASVVLVIRTDQRPSQLEYLVNKRFAHKRLANFNLNPGGKREWFSLDADDLAWLRGLALHLSLSHA